MPEVATGRGRIGTGVAELDEILGGGFPENSINIVMGHPGTGKTIVAEQLLFHNANGNRPVLYLTTLSEPLTKVITYLQRFGFYDEGKLGDSVIYDDIGPDLVERGVKVVLERVTEAIRELGPSIIVIDSFKAIHDLAPSVTEMRELIASLAGVLTSFATTTFLVGEYSESQIPQFPEFAVADGILELARRSTAKRDERYLRVLKLRGSQYAEGLHAFTITGDGLKVYPRLVTPTQFSAYDVNRERVTTGTEGLDQLLDGGPWRGSNTLVVGSAGTGKTTVGLAFALEGIRQGEQSLFVNFQENPTQLATAIDAFGHADVLHDGGLRTLYASPVELQIDSVVVDIFRIIEDGRVRRVVIDSLGDLILASADRERFHDYLYSLCQHFASKCVTSLLTLETTTHQPQPWTGSELRVSSMSDVLIELGFTHGSEPARTLRVIKARGIAHDLGVHPFSIERGRTRVLRRALS